MTTLVPNEVVALVFAGDLSPMRAWRELLDADDLAVQGPCTHARLA